MGDARTPEGQRAARTPPRSQGVKKERKKTRIQGRDVAGRASKKERKKTDNPREGWEDGTPPPHRDFKERGVMR